ncbi:hypothetical protein PFISCL1PPCAC_3827, partial [Pristionchus fissidentatus]
VLPITPFPLSPTNPSRLLSLITMAYNAGRSASNTNQAYGQQYGQYSQQQYGGQQGYGNQQQYGSQQQQQLYAAGYASGAQYQAGFQSGAQGTSLSASYQFPSAEFEAGYQAGSLQYQAQLQSQQPQKLGAGYGQRYLAPAEIQNQLAGKPAFYDNVRGIYYDGKRAWYYDNSGAFGARNSYSSGSVITAIEQGPSGTVIRIGNGTHGNPEELRNHPSSVYYTNPQAL